MTAAEFLFFVWKCFYFFLPAYFSNMAPVICKNIPFMKSPVDCGLVFHGRRVFGDHKTWRGLFVGIIFGIGVAFIQMKLQPFHPSWHFYDYEIRSSWLYIGFLLGFGAIFGDLIKSFFKRQSSHPPGKPFIPFDQVDFILGGLIMAFVFVPSWKVALTVLIISPILHILINHLAFYTRIRNEKW